MLEPFGKQGDEKFGLNSELFNNLKRGTTLVEYRYVCVCLFVLNSSYVLASYVFLQTQLLCLHVAALQILPKNSMLGTCDLQLLVSLA